MSRPTLYHCDGCSKKDFNRTGWHAGGIWYEGYGIRKIEVYMADVPEPPDDPDRTLDFCSVGCLLDYLTAVLAGKWPEKGKEDAK